ncbi:hypothetical protein BZA77DRAFT_352162 [Pyronema omphalodes]|nr:hypothetical protein BZA77DRAFT_359346 [Pyronema omphalodes]KAI5817974.1 hypothetical protein BZA77DRAFT_352162 [Pyronema omphalodes]
MDYHRMNTPQSPIAPMETSRDHYMTSDDSATVVDLTGDEPYSQSLGIKKDVELEVFKLKKKHHDITAKLENRIQQLEQQKAALEMEVEYLRQKDIHSHNEVGEMNHREVHTARASSITGFQELDKQLEHMRRKIQQTMEMLPVSEPGPPFLEPLTHTNWLHDDEGTVVNNRFSATEEHITYRQSPDAHTTQIQPARTYISSMQRKRLLRENRAIYIAPAMKVQHKRASILRSLLEYIADVAPAGMVRVLSANDHYYVIVFKSTKLRDNALDTLKAQEFVFEKAPIPLNIQTFGYTAETPNVIWHMTVGVLSSVKDVRTAVKMYFQERCPTFSSTFEVRAKKHMGIRTGEFYVRFDRPPPRIAMRQINVGGFKAIINRLKFYICGFCNTSGHTVFQCQNPGDSSLSKHASEGSVGDPDVTTPSEKA